MGGLLRSVAVVRVWDENMASRDLVGLLFLILLSPLAHGAEAPGMPVTPREVLRPFNGKDLGGFTTWLKQTGRDDPRQVFRVQDGMLRCGAEDMGYLATRDAYQNYHLVVEYKWGERNPRDKFVRNSGVLLHA